MGANAGTIEFTAYCLEEYKAAEKLRGADVMRLFRRYGVLDYIAANYGALHTTGAMYLVEDIKQFIENRREKEPTADLVL
ncbi:MAG: DUF3791 domain-containing protein [Synergistaceae bacterium]|jgi:hypothetical protein|nr:DUF3791 domain-containing protein [Synergistaceae bacterium]